MAGVGDLLIPAQENLGCGHTCAAGAATTRGGGRLLRESIMEGNSWGGTRTPNPRIMTPLLYRLSYPANEP